MGGSIFVHTFGAMFGNACSLAISPKGLKNHPKAGGDYNS